MINCHDKDKLQLSGRDERHGNVGVNGRMNESRNELLGPK